MSILSELEGFKSIPNSSIEPRSLATTLIGFNVDFLHRLSLQEIKGAQFPKFLFVIEGPPSSGKDYLARKVKPAIDLFLNHLRSQGKEIPLTSIINWEDAQNSARMQGLIKTEKGKLYTQEELESSYVQLKTLIATNLTDRSIVIVTIPGPTAVPNTTSKDWIEPKTYASRLNYDLTVDGSPYQDLFRNGLVRGHVGIIPGPNIKLLSYFRFAVNNAVNMEEANLACRHFGQKEFTSRQLWDKHKEAGGANPYQVSRALEVSRKLAEVIRERNGLELEDLGTGNRKNAISVARMLGIDEKSFVANTRKELGITQLYLLNWGFTDSSLGIKPPEHIFIGYNNPPVNPPYPNRLKEYIRLLKNRHTQLYDVIW